jgi:hypothetical protein
MQAHARALGPRVCSGAQACGVRTGGAARPCCRCASEPGHRPARSGGHAAGEPRRVGGAGRPRSTPRRHVADTSPTSRRQLEVLEASRPVWLRGFVPGETTRLPSTSQLTARARRVYARAARVLNAAACEPPARRESAAHPVLCHPARVGARQAGFCVVVLQSAQPPAQATPERVGVWAQCIHAPRGRGGAVQVRVWGVCEPAGDRQLRACATAGTVHTRRGGGGGSGGGLGLGRVSACGPATLGSSAAAAAAVEAAVAATMQQPEQRHRGASRGRRGRGAAQLVPKSASNGPAGGGGFSPRLAR